MPQKDKINDEDSRSLMTGRDLETVVNQTSTGRLNTTQTYGQSESGRLFPILTVLRGEQVDARFMIDKPEIWIGRDPSCEIHLLDSQASRRHAVVVYENISAPNESPVVHVRDNNSTNGTRVNGKEIKRQTLDNLDRVAIGRTLMGFSFKDMLEINADSRLVEKATTDQLTGLKNRMAFHNFATLEFTRAKRYGRPVSFIILDLDHFKSVNDEHGHQAGDEVLKKTGKLILAQIREIDYAFRYGGEEIVVLLPETGVDGAEMVAERLRMTIENSPVSHGGKTIRFTASLGVAAIAHDSPDWETILGAADAALYEAKNNGRNRVVVNR